MYEEKPLDLSALDPPPDHWKVMMRDTLVRVEAALLKRRADPLSTIANWSRPLMLAAAATIALLVPIEIMLEKREDGVEQLQTLVRLSTLTALGESTPTGAELSRLLDRNVLP